MRDEGLIQGRKASQNKSIKRTATGASAVVVLHGGVAVSTVTAVADDDERQRDDDDDGNDGNGNNDTRDGLAALGRLGGSDLRGEEGRRVSVGGTVGGTTREAKRRDVSRCD